MEEKLSKLVQDSQKTGHLITVRQLANKLRIKQKEVLEICEDQCLCINVGILTYGGYGVYEKIGDYSIEDLENYG